MTELDHITIAALSLAQGVAYLQDRLGIEIPYGGAHPRMATHNHLLRLGDTVFLEVIAIDPTAPAPPRPRWFGLDDPALRAELQSAPRLLTWVVRTARIAEVFLASRRPLGAIEPMTRGELRWLITFPNDGSLVEAGLVPSVIQWPAGAHPASRMRDLGCSLERFLAVHPDPEPYRRDLASIGADRHVEITQAAPGARPHLVVQVRTPGGVRTLR
ncbi:MAG TPA: VOC family protein [Kofleriaceae bacterium]|nr:VOC family protein [Kofleriaceae bacterium]